jgi:hypothetical protein
LLPVTRLRLISMVQIPSLPPTPVGRSARMPCDEAVSLFEEGLDPPDGLGAVPLQRPQPDVAQPALAVDQGAGGQGLAAPSVEGLSLGVQQDCYEPRSVRTTSPVAGWKNTSTRTPCLSV